MFDYNKILEIEEINLVNLDNVTLIDHEILELGHDKTGERNFLVVEVWKDENNEIKILHQDDETAEEITTQLTVEQKEHIYKLVAESLRKLQ